MTRPPRGRRLASSATVPTLAAGFAVGLAALTVPAAAQPAGGPELSPVAEAVGAMVITLVVGGGWILLAPDYTERVTDRIHEAPGQAGVYGLAIAAVLFVVIVVGIITVIGILVVIPLLIGIIVVAELGYLAVGRLVSREWTVALAVAIVVSAVTGGVPILGGLVGFVLSCLAFGAVYLEYRDDGTGGRQRTTSGSARPGSASTSPRVPTPGHATEQGATAGSSGDRESEDTAGRDRREDG